MALRKWISVVALVGVLLHAGAVVRHNAGMLGALFQHQALLADLAQICHGVGSGDAQSTADLPFIPMPSDAQKGCPICSGLVSPFGLTPPAPAWLPPPAHQAAHQPIAVAALPVQPRTAHPPARGPPSLA
jgi:Protein of unknown function (DUF2946)